MNNLDIRAASETLKAHPLFDPLDCEDLAGEIIRGQGVAPNPINVQMIVRYTTDPAYRDQIEARHGAHMNRAAEAPRKPVEAPRAPAGSGDPESASTRLQRFADATGMGDTELGRLLGVGRMGAYYRRIGEVLVDGLDEHRRSVVDILEVRAVLIADLLDELAD